MKLDGKCAGCGIQMEELFWITCPDCWVLLREKNSKLRGQLPNAVGKHRRAVKELEEFKERVHKVLQP